MEIVLRPGMRLMRHLGVAGKFGLIAVLLLMPLCISMVSAFQDATEQISITDREREGLTYVAPLGRLVVELTQSRNLALHGQRPGEAWIGIVRELDDATLANGEQLGVGGDWANLRSDVVTLYSEETTLDGLADGAERISRRVHQLIKKVADSSRLTLDPQLDSHYLVMIMTDRLPRLVLAAGDAQALRNRDDITPDAMTLGVSASDFNDAARQLNYDLATAITTTSWTGLRHQVAAEAWALNTAIYQYAQTLTSDVDRPGRVPAAEQLDVAALSTSAAALGNVLSNSLDQLLVQRHDQLMADRSRPLVLTLVILAVVFYLLTALFRATTRDVRAVLEDISTVTNGALNQTTALSGSDEFSRMSQAVIYARDRLTALVGTLKYQATHDELTALANRGLFTEKVEEALAALSLGAASAGSTGHRAQVAVLLIDLDSFKDVNDSFGHDLGDRLLRMVGARIHRSVPRRSVVARLGSDEFAVLVTDTRQPLSAREMLSRLEETLAQPVDIEGRLLSVQAGIGIAMAEPGAGITAVELIRNADVALSYAKNRGKGHSVVFEPTMHNHTRERTELSAELVSAIDRGEMNVVYQPLVDLHTSTLHGVEALLRWDHPVRGQISPAVFVPLAETTGQITRIGRWVLVEACRQLATWQRDFPDAYPLTMEVNLATEQLADKDLVADVLTTVQSTGIDASALVLEITESALVRDIETAMTRLGQLSAMGLKIALDDFGTGYSSLSYLRRLPATVLKIDKSFLDDESDEGRSLLRGIVDMGAGQGMQIVSEGIETPAQVEFMRSAGCHLGQGHYWSQAVCAERITEIIRAGGRMPPALVSGARLPLQRDVQVSDPR